MKYAFQTMRLAADSYYALISNWADMQLRISDDEATLQGYGFASDIAEAFSTLVLDWEATIILPRDTLALAPGSYDLMRQEEDLYAFREQQSFRLPDAPVIVEVVSVPDLV